MQSPGLIPGGPRIGAWCGNPESALCSSLPVTTSCFRSLLLGGNIFAQEDALTREGQGGRARAVLVGLGAGYDLSW